MRIFIPIIILLNLLNAESLDKLLKDYEYTSKTSLKTVNEKLGHVVTYTQEDIQLYQYTKLNDILKEIPSTNTKNKFGLDGLSLAGTNSLISGFFRIFLNDNEISSIQTQSANLTWANLPLDFIDHVEIYYGEGSFSLGTEPGIFFIRLYTKDSQKTNGTTYNAYFDKNYSNSNSIMHSQYLQNDWSYLIYANNTNIKEDIDLKNEKLHNDSNNNYLFLEFKNPRNKINLGYSNISKDNFMGHSRDLIPDEGNIKSKDLFINSTNYFLEDKSLKTFLSYGVQYKNYYEENIGSRIDIIPYLSENITSFNEDLKFSKTSFNVSKNYNYKNNSFLIGLNLSQKRYTTKDISVNDVSRGEYTDFNKETLYSISLQDDYKISNDLILIANAKFDKYERNGYLDNSNESMYRVGTIYTPTNNFGIKTFYTKTYLNPSFLNSDFSAKKNFYTQQEADIKSQQYKYYTIEAVYNYLNSNFKVQYHNVKVDDFIYFMDAIPSFPGFEDYIGYMNLAKTIKTEGYQFYYDYKFNNNFNLQLNYFLIKLNETINTPSQGGYIKFNHKLDNYSYFVNLLYRNASSYGSYTSDSSFDLNLGATYKYSKDLSFSFKAENILNDSQKTLYFDRSVLTSELKPQPTYLKNTGRNISLNMKWSF